jgi:hypothetical protein
MATLYDEMSGPRYLSSSISSLSASRQQSSQIAKAYRQAAQLFLTRRLPEALSTIEPIISPAPQEDTNGKTSDGELVGCAPIATASRGTRVKDFPLLSLSSPRHHMMRPTELMAISRAMRRLQPRHEGPG